MPITEDIRSQAEKIVVNAGKGRLVDMVPIFYGGNNRAWRLETNKEPLFLKQYFRSDKDRRDRFGTELSFLSYTWSLGVRCIPQPLAANRADLIALFVFIDGKRISQEQVDRCAIDRALHFIKQVNTDNTTLKAQCLAPASESCFSIAAHIESVEKRCNRLLSIEGIDTITRSAQRFIKNELHTRWCRIKKNILHAVSQKRIYPNQLISRDEMILSPSDFGFHNALLSNQGTFYFIDFEYAGWDDPAKLVCDFFSQPEIPVPIRFFKPFIGTLSKSIGTGHHGMKQLLWRASLLFPLYRLKWCCIMLNDFISVSRKRKDFASFGIDKRKVQLEKASIYIKDIDHGIR